MSSDPEEDTVWLLCDLSNQLEDLQVPIKLNPDIKVQILNLQAVTCFLLHIIKF